MREIVTRTEKLSYTDDGIIKCVALPDIIMGLNEAKENIEAVKAIANGKIIPVLVDITQSKGATKEARAYLASADVAKVQSACALLISSSLSQLIGNFFLGLNKTKFPVKLFKDEAKAIEWLKTFL